MTNLIRTGQLAPTRTLLFSLALAATSLITASAQSPEPAPAPTPVPPTSPLDLGNAAANKGDLDTAIADFTQAIQMYPKSAVAYNGRGLAYGKKGDFDKAIADFSQAVLLDPTDAPGFYNRALAYQNKGDYVNAIADNKQTIQLVPKIPDGYNNLAWILATCPEASLRDGKKAVESATKACELSGWKNPNYIDTLAAACAEAGDFDNAVKWETQFLQTPNLSADDAADAKTHLALYQAHQPFHTTR